MKFSDHDKPFASVSGYLPQVYQSNVNQSLFGTTYDRFLSKDNTVQVTGFIGVGNPQALINKQITETSTHRQAFQLAPTMIGYIGSEQYALSYKGFLAQLQAMGVNTNTQPTWGSSTMFNWAPPINIDMLINYQDYYWVGSNSSDTPQYFTIESQCNKATSKVKSYGNMITSRGGSFNVIQTNFVDNEFVIDGNLIDVFVTGFQFFTDQTSNINLSNKLWTVNQGTTYNTVDNTTSIAVMENIAASGALPPTSPALDQWWFNTANSTLNVWNGTAWVLTSVNITFNIDLTKQLSIYQYQANCACRQSWGWDAGQWDQGLGEQYDFANECIPQAMNQWSTQNKWVHKSEVQSFTDVKRAQVPILEYGSNVEVSNWSKVEYLWKYRAQEFGAFANQPNPPSRLELEPIKGFVVANTGAWQLFLTDNSIWGGKQINYRTSFPVGSTFKIVDDNNNLNVYTVKSHTYRKVGVGDPGSVIAVTGADVFCSVIELVEATFLSPAVGGGSQNVRIEPVLTSRGHIWRGYHTHWVLSDTAQSPVESQAQNFDLEISIAAPPAPIQTSTIPAHGDTGLPFVSVGPSITVGKFYQSQIVQASGTQIDLVDVFRLVDGQPSNTFSHSGTIRVYINNVRQFGTYTEVSNTVQLSTLVINPATTYVGIGEVTSAQSITYVTGIVFNDALKLYDEVRIEVGAAGFAELGTESVPVRTVEDDASFQLEMIAGRQPVYQPLWKFNKLEQYKAVKNQYPLFNIYDISSSTVISSSPTFEYVVDSQNDVDPNTNKRIFKQTNGKEYKFAQTLVDSLTGKMYGFRDISSVPQYWYSRSNVILRQWRGGWTSDVLSIVNGLQQIITTVVESATQPPNEDGMGWYNTTTGTISIFNGTMWVGLNNVSVQDNDPTLQTIWRRGANNEQYVPQYVDKDRNVVPVGSSQGDWELPHQWKYNPSHQNRTEIKYSELITHFRTIIQQQTPIPGLQGGGIFSLTQQAYNYGVGGTIKEFNYGYDTLISAVNVDSATPISVIEFAQRQYSTQLLAIKEAFNSSAIALLTSTSEAALSDFDQFVSKKLIDQFEQNDYPGIIYKDTTSFDNLTGAGVRNWIATIPNIVGGNLYLPHSTIDGKVVNVFHHDGHRSTINYSNFEYDQYARRLCNTVDNRGGNQTFGVISGSTPPGTISGVITAFGQARPITYWYTTGVNNKLHKFNVFFIGSAFPSFFLSTGEEVRDGTKIYHTTNAAAYVKSGLAWVPISIIGSGDVTPLWETVNINSILGTTIVEIETRLADVIKKIPPKFDFGTLTNTPSGLSQYTQLMRGRFSGYLSDRGIAGGLSNNQYSLSDPFTWNYITSQISTTPLISSPTIHKASHWEALYDKWYGTPYPHLEPWRLQLYKDKPTWWDNLYKDTTGGRQWIYNHNTQTGMWENIRTGVVPVGYPYPSGKVSTGNSFVDGVAMPTYAYFSVNISNGIIPGGYNPDQLLPPYYDNNSIAITLPTVRSIFSSYNSDINTPEADYSFGDQGPREWEWLISDQYPYDVLVVAFLMQPVKFLHACYGPGYIDCKGLLIDNQTNKVYSHKDAQFHGDLTRENELYVSNGIGQWYVNFNRYSGTDTNTTFREKWVGWNPKLTYQFGGIIDDSTLEVSSKYFDIADQDYQISLVNNGVIDEVWAEGFNVTLLNIAPSITQYNNQGNWRLELDNLAPIPRSFVAFGVKSYQVNPTLNTNQFNALTFNITNVNTAGGWVEISGDHRLTYLPNVIFAITGGGLNNGSYTVKNATVIQSTNSTRIFVQTPIPSNVVSGQAVIQKALPWSNGDQVVVQSTKFLPAPLTPDTVYFITNISGQVFELADTRDDALLGNSITLTSLGSGTVTVSQIDSSFMVMGGAGNSLETWYHYAIDDTSVITVDLPYQINGMQSIINLFDGYVQYNKFAGIVQGTADNNFDPQTGRVYSWTNEIDKFIDWAYGLRQSNVVITDKYNVTCNPTTNEFTFVSQVPTWLNGTKVSVDSTGGLPTPLTPQTTYYVVNTGVAGVIKLSTSPNATDTVSVVDLTTSGLGTLYIKLYDVVGSYPTHEINPHRNNIWVDTPYGILSNAISGPYRDIRVNQTVFDQYGNTITPDNIAVYRQDKRTHLLMKQDVLVNDAQGTLSDDTLHIGGAHLFIEGYEHFLIFNDYTTGGALVHDSFLGLQATKFNLDYKETKDFTLRPTLGGYYLLDGKFNKNFEGTVSDINKYYDAYELPENTPISKRARELLGYRGNKQYLDYMNLNSKSQFLFYRGMIQTKGSVNSIKAFINSRRFVDAKLDEFWAWKIAEYGDAKIKTFPEIKLFSTDSLKDDVRLQFLASSETTEDVEVQERTTKGFEPINFVSSTRWNIFPEQRSIIGSPLFLDGDVDSVTKIFGADLPPQPNGEAVIDVWYNTTNKQAYTFNPATKRWDVQSNILQGITLSNIGDVVYVSLPTQHDEVRVIHKTVSTSVYPIQSITANTILINGDVTNELNIDTPFSIVESSLNNNYFYPVSVDFNGAITTITIAGSLNPLSTLGSVLVKDINSYTTETYTTGTGVKEIMRVNSSTIRLNSIGVADIIEIYTITPATSKLSPAKLIDVKRNFTVSSLPMWDPARGIHSPIASHNIDIQSTDDPAQYTVHINPQQVSQREWNFSEVGKTWMDTSQLSYLPYYDSVVYPDINDRLYKWGKMSEHGKVRVCKWIKSPVPPDQWNSYINRATEQDAVNNGYQLSGEPVSYVFVREREKYTDGVNCTIIIHPTSALANPDSIELVSGPILNNQDRVIFNSSGSTPGGIIQGTEYIIINKLGNFFQLQDVLSEEVVTLSTVGSGILNFVTSFNSTQWVKHQTKQVLVQGVQAVKQLAANDGIISIGWPVTLSTTFTVVGIPHAGDSTIPQHEQNADVYFNGILIQSGAAVVWSPSMQSRIALVDSNVTINEFDSINVVYPVHQVTDDDRAEAEEDDGTTTIQWKEQSLYTARVDQRGNMQYYFWVTNELTTGSDSQYLNTLEIERDLVEPSMPYMIVQNPKDDPYLLETFGYGSTQYGSAYSLGVLSEAQYNIPISYRSVILRKISNIINTDDTFIVKFTRDWTLRDGTRNNSLDNKNAHAEWEMFRKDQTSSIPKALWNKAVESLIGHKLNDPTIRVPSFQRELYDNLYGTDTRYGLGEDQAFVDKSLGISTITRYLTNPNNNLAPIDVDSFLTTYRFDTPEHIEQAMDAIYNSFNVVHINAMWFQLLEDALTTRANFRELIKTSWVSLYGIRVLEVQGLFDE